MTNIETSLVLQTGCTQNYFIFG